MFKPIHAVDAAQITVADMMAQLHRLLSPTPTPASNRREVTQNNVHGTTSADLDRLLCCSRATVFSLLCMKTFHVHMIKSYEIVTFNLFHSHLLHLHLNENILCQLCGILESLCGRTWGQGQRVTSPANMATLQTH